MRLDTVAPIWNFGKFSIGSNAQWPAMAARVTDKLWEMSDVMKVLEDWEESRSAA